ncbi:sporulation-specific protein 15 isoform X3 [Drosophila pseudoobscura]|uniref:Sporulation-specific protein 15 isoform X3 n=1 Tax=Drosophila pseudoobscura pseudoobscura TaxID=46245 RepID=A0A6I8VIL0_DROPS|nr:sporulation-specific protein 15 isoform X3 [Drosophila pseudoobscura]
MDIRSWKSVILSWVQKCGFVDENVLTLEQSNIYKFFEHYLEYDYMHLALDTTDSTHSDLSSRNDTQLIKFLQTVYPDFAPNLDTSGNLDRSDYFLVYTLMLHYACVIKKSTQYQIKCTELPEHIQKAIASFLSRIVNSHKITRLCLVEALETTKKFFEPAAPPAMVLPYTTSTVRQALMEAAIIPADSEAPGTPVKAITDSPQTPQDTPLHSSRDEYSPLPICSTPMRERERMTVFEWRQVMDKLAATEIKLAELETKLTSAERKLISTENEYSILDELFQEVSKTKVNLQNANKELKAEIEILREKIQIFEERSIDEEADGRSNFEHLKQGYLKEIAAKEAIIAEINEHLQDAISANVKENARVREIEEQLKKCFDQINMLNLTVNQNKAVLRDKDFEISCLERDKQDLAQCLNVLRQESQGRREVLNASSDMLDTSLSPGSVPENLGSCVIEKQLREKDQEICQLKEEFAKLQSDIYKLINAEVKVEPSFKDQTQLLKAICDALIVSPQAAAEYESRKLHNEIEILLAELQSEKDARADMHDPHDKECIQMTCELAFIDEDLDNEKQIVAKQHKRILEAQQRLDSLALTEKYNKQLDELQHQLEILETELPQMASHCVLNYLEDEKASDEMSRQSLEETKRLEQQINSKPDLLKKKESEVAEVKDQIALLQQKMKDEGAKGRLQAPARMAELDQLVKDRKVLAITSREQSQRLAHRHDRLDKLELARKKKEMQIKNENHDPDSEIGRYYARELQELESKCHFTLQKCVQAKAEAAEQADKLSHVLQRLEQIQYQNERSIEVATTKEERAAQKDSDTDLIAEKDAKIVELSVEMMVLTDKLDSLADDRARLKASAKEHRKNASILQKSLDLLSAERSGLAKKLGMQKSLLKMYGKSIQVLLEKQNSQEENEKCYEQKLKKLQEEHSDVIKKLELGIDQWRERYENLENDISAQKEIASTNERKHQDTVQAHARTIAKLRDDYNTLEKDLLHKQNCCEEDRKKLNERVVLLTEERDTLRLHKDILKKELDTLSQERDTLTLCSDTVNQERNNLNALYATLLKERDNLKESNGTLQKERDNLNALYATVVKERNNLKESNGTLQKERDNLNEFYATLLKERDNLNKSKGTLQKEHDNLNELYATLLKERDNLKECNGTLQKERDNLYELYATLLKESDNLNKSNGTLQKERDNLYELYATLLKESDNLNKSKGTLQKEHDNLNELYATLLKERDNLNESNGTLQKERDNLNELYATLQKERDNLNESNGTLQKERDNLNELYATLQKERDNLNESNGTLQKERDNLNELYATLQKERDNLNESNGTLQKERDNLNELYATLLKERDNLNESNGTLQKERDNLNELYATLLKERDNLNESNGTLLIERDNLKVAEQQHQTEISRFVNMEREIWGMLDNTTEKIQALSEINTNENKENRQLHGVSSLRQVNCLEMLKEILYQKDMQIEALRKEREMIRKSERATKTTLHMLTKECDAKEARLSQEIGCLNYNLMQAKQLVQQQQLSHDTETQLKIDASQALEAAKQELQEVREQMLKIETEHAHDKQHFELMAQQFQAQHAQILQEKADLQADILKQQDDFRTLEKDLLYKQKCLEEGHQKLYERMLMLKEERNTLTQERDTLKQELDAQNQEHEAFRKERCTLKLYNDTLKQDLISVGKQLKEEVSRQQIETEARAMTEKQLSLVQHQLEQSEQKYARLKIEMTDQQTTSDERQIELSKQLNAAKTELAETMERLSATYTAAAEEEGLPDRTTLQRDCQVLQAKYQEAKKKIDELQVNLKDQRNEMEGKLEKMKNKMDGPHSLDDSMSALLSSSTSTGARKKSMGTHYKRPGPPTPSKNGGRLSFGSSEPPREILRETCENTGTSKTPTRFKMFTSRFSIGSTTSGSSGLPRDERPLRRERPNLLTGMQRRRLQLRQSSGLFCTSTPRKSRSYYDQRRLICASDAISDHEEDEEEVEQEGNEQEPEQEQENVAEELEEEGTPHLSNAALLAITRGVTRRLSNDPRYSSPSSGSTPQFGGGKRKYRKGRVSLCLHGNIFARSRPLTKNTAAAHAGNLKQQREKLKQQRLNRFDQGRHFNESPVPAVTFQQSPIADNLLRQHQAPTNVTYKLLQPLDRCANNNYSQHNRNKEQQQQQDQQLLLMMGQTVVLRPEDQILDDGLLPVAATTFNVSETDSTDMWQHRQGFEGENIQAWLTEYARERETPIEMENEDSHGGHFERLCRETESTAPFELQPLHYKEQEEQPKVRSVRLLNITGTTSVCTTNASCATNLTSASSQKSCTIYSLGNIQSEPLPTMTITHVEQRLVHHERRTKTLTLRELWYTFCRLNLPGRLMLSLALALTMMLCSQVADRMALGVTAAFGLLLLVLSLSCGK